MYKFLTCLFSIAIAANSQAQYFYKDIISTRQVSNNYKLLKTAKVNTVTLKSFVGDKEVTEGFDCNQKVVADKVITYTKTTDAGESFFTAFYNKQGLMIESIDSAGNVASESNYTYDATGKLLTMQNSSRSSTIVNTEIHTYQYNAQGQPTGMRKVRNIVDSTFISFVLDEKGNIIEERAKRNNGVPQPTIYYYYDDKNRLTDVVRFNQKVKKMLPDYMFEYDDNNQLSVMTLVPEGTNDYQKWYYKYDEDGLKAADFCYNKKNELLGKILYEYTYSK